MTPPLNMRQRAKAYANAFPQFPDSHFSVSDRWISATWILGNNYKSLSARSDKDQPFFGSYPPGYLKRIWPMFPDVTNVVHLFSGSLTKEAAAPPQDAWVTRIDAHPERKPDLLRDAEDFVDAFEVQDKLVINPSTLDLILADPPYSEQDAKSYGVPLCNKRKVLEQCHLALRPGGTLLWMDQALPMFAKRNWKWTGVITMIRSTNHRVRAVFMFQKV